MDPDRDDENPIGPDLTALERRLAGWQPSAGSLDRDRMLYDAGRAAAGARTWRAIAASLLIASVGLAALLAHQHSSLVRERALLSQERAERLQVETALAARPAAAQPATSSPLPAAIEPPSPSSYLALSARMADGLDDLLSRGSGIDPAPTRSAPANPGEELHPEPLRPRDVRRVLEL